MSLKKTFLGLMSKYNILIKKEEVYANQLYEDLYENPNEICSKYFICIDFMPDSYDKDDNDVLKLLKEDLIPMINDHIDLFSIVKRNRKRKHDGILSNLVNDDKDDRNKDIDFSLEGYRKLIEVYERYIDIYDKHKEIIEEIPKVNTELEKINEKFKENVMKKLDGYLDNVENLKIIYGKGIDNSLIDGLYIGYDYVYGDKKKVTVQINKRIKKDYKLEPSMDFVFDADKREDHMCLRNYLNTILKQEYWFRIE